MDNSYIIINQKKVNIIDWSFTILQISESLGLSIPRFCYHRELSIAGNCRMCMVEVKNSLKPVIACATSLTKEMVIFTNSELVKIARENVIEFLLINHPLDCPICDQGGECDLQDQTIIYGSDRGRFTEIKRSVSNKYFGPIVKSIMTRCIHCTRCVRFAEEIIGTPILGTMGRGGDTEISTYVSKILHSELIGNIVDLCPVGALTSKPYAFRARPWELEHMECIDIFDSLGSYIRMDVKGNEILRCLPRRNDLLNREWITDKVRFYYQGSLVDRLTFPLVTLEDNYFRRTLNHCSIKFAFTLFTNEYVKALSKKNALIMYNGGNLDIIDTTFSREFSNQLDFHLFYIDQNKKKILPNLRNEWLLNSNINDFINKENILFLNVNLKYESSVLNALLLQNINETENQYIYYIGFYFKNIYMMHHIALGIDILNQLQNGKHYFCTYLLNTEFNFVESGIEPLFNFTINSYVQIINNFTNKKNNISYIASNATELNIYETGISIEKIEKKKVSFFYMIGNTNNINFIKPKSNFSVFQGHHVPEKNIYSYNLFFPISVFHEVSTNYNYMSGWFNNQLIYNIFIDKLITSPGDSNSNLYFFYCILNILFKHFSKNNNIFVKKQNSIWDNFNNFYYLYEFESHYNKTYINNININQQFNNIYIDKINFNSVISDVFYLSNVFSRHSVTLLASHQNESRYIDLLNI
jgi:NADH dehydrogenase (ubiquinone) Fe-S protein 1